ncbi:MAG: hypothetical protein VKJ46_08975 [Leptolyngbyaceae bacterium]|nr:hypothetical protein [Leptolyngbyaceae bacterium]
MTGDYVANGEGQDIAAGPAYPSAFGITFTPMISGVLLGVLGLGAAVYLFLNLVQPALQKSQELDAKVAELSGQAQQQQGNPQKAVEAKAALEQAKQQKQDVLGLFADASTLDTLLLDLNREFTKGQAKLNNFAPAGPVAPISGQPLKQQEIAIAMDGDFAQTQAVLRNLERLQPLVVIKDFNTTKDASEQKLVIDQQGKPVTKGEVVLKTSFKLQVTVPLSKEEMEAAAKAAAEAAAAAAPPK